ncbi:MAG: YiaA/YiaB family inner membrane protein [Pseudomonadota bacterium]
MSDETLNLPQSNAWNFFTIISFIIAAGMMAGGIYFLEASFAAKGFYSMSALMLVHTTVSITKTLRDREESLRLHNRLEEARTEKLLKEVNTDIAA